MRKEFRWRNSVVLMRKDNGVRQLTRSVGQGISSSGENGKILIPGQDNSLYFVMRYPDLNFLTPQRDRRGIPLAGQSLADGIRWAFTQRSANFTAGHRLRNAEDGNQSREFPRMSES